MPVHLVILVFLVFEARSAEGRIERKITVAKLKDSFQCSEWVGRSDFSNGTGPTQ